MRIPRVPAAILAAVIGGAAAFFVDAGFESLGTDSDGELVGGIFLAVTVGVLALGERVGLIAGPYRRSLVLGDTDEHHRD